jgi:hypothetical protein
LKNGGTTGRSVSSHKEIISKGIRVADLQACKYGIFFLARGWILFDQAIYMPILMLQHNGMDSIKIKGS